MTVVLDIPDIMKRRGWTQGAALMRRWLRSPGNNRPERGEPDLSTVTVDWTLGYSRANQVFQQALRDKIWTQEDGRRRIHDTIERRIYDPRKQSSLLFVDGLHMQDPHRFTSANTESIYIDRAAHAPVPFTIAVDGLTAALARFGYYFNVCGACEPQEDGFMVHVDRVGVYIRDSYDFNDNHDDIFSQPLGFWDTRDSYVGIKALHCWEDHIGVYMPPLFEVPGIPYQDDAMISLPQCGWATSFSNIGFREFRTRTGIGGDFLVYSDIVYIETDDHFLV